MTAPWHGHLLFSVDVMALRELKKEGVKDRLLKPFLTNVQRLNSLLLLRKRRFLSQYPDAPREPALGERHIADSRRHSLHD
jgi:hypothetical protein